MIVALLVPYFPPDSNQSALMYGALAEDLVAQGCEVIVVTAQPHYSSAAARTTVKPWSVTKTRHATIVRTFVPPLNRASIWSRLLVTLSYNWFGALWLLFHKRPDVAFMPNPAYLCAGVAAVAIVKRARLHYRIHDLYPDIAIRLGLIQSKSTIGRVLGRLEALACSRAECVTVVTEAFQTALRDRGWGSNKVTVIPDWVDTQAIRPGKRKNLFSRQHGLDDKCVLMYGGNVGLSQGLEVLLDAADRLRRRDDIVILIIGDGAGKRRLVEEQRRRGLNNVRFLPSQSLDALREVYASADIGFVSLLPGVAPEWCPAKVYTTMASGRPVLAATGVDGSEASRIVQRFDCGVCVPSGDAAALAGAVVHLADSPATRARLGAQGRAAAEAHFSRAACTLALFQMCVSSLSKAAPVS